MQRNVKSVCLARVEELALGAATSRGRNPKCFRLKSKKFQEEIQNISVRNPNHRTGRNVKSVCLARVEELSLGAATSQGRNPKCFRLKSRKFQEEIQNIS